MSDIYDNYIHSFVLSREYDREFFEIVGDLYDSPEVQGLKKYPQHSTVNRLDHITSVTYLTYVYAKRRGQDYVSATRAAMLHDLFYYDWHENDWSHRPHGYRHPGFAVKNARELNPGITRKEEKIILRHMWPLTVVPPESAEGFTVSLCDKYCASLELLIAGTKRFGDKFASDLAAARQRLSDV